MLRSGDLILVQADQVEPSLAFIEQFIATNSGTDNGAECTCETVSTGGTAAELPVALNGQAENGAAPIGTASGASESRAAHDRA
jgi:hypothetical protein